MRRKNAAVLIAIAVPFVVLLAILALQFANNGVYHCGRCGAQRWVFDVLWMDFGESNYDEFGIQERWTTAHKKNCEHIWIKGTLESDKGEYWPSLHLQIAQGGDLAEIKRKIATLSSEQLKQKDALGRTILHWLVIHPDKVNRQSVIDMALSKGLGLDDKDNDGLSPRDWQANSK